MIWYHLFWNSPGQKARIFPLPNNDADDDESDDMQNNDDDDKNENYAEDDDDNDYNQKKLYCPYFRLVLQHNC